MRYLLSCLLIISHLCTAQTITFHGAGGPINDVSVNSFPRLISAMPATIDSNYGVKSVMINLTHTWDGDLQIFLKSPAGVMVDLSINNGWSGHDYDSTYFVQTATTDIFNSGAPFTGHFRPQGWLGSFNNGENPNGTWTLYCNDVAGSDAGNLLEWSITFDTVPAHPFPFLSSNLPIVKINTLSQHVVDDPSILSKMQIINHPGALNYYADAPDDYNGFIGIQYRGSTSQTFAQKPYGFSTTDSLLQDLDYPVLGMPAEHDWVLYNPWDDRSLIRNALIYELSNEMGRYAARCRFVELFVNDEYEGVYVLMEKVKRDNNRVDIKKLQPADTTGDNLTGGYIGKIDKTTGAGSGGWYSSFDYCGDTALHSKLYFQYEYPKQQDMPAIQANYFAAYVDSFEQAMNGPAYQDTVIGWRRYFSSKAAIDFSILNEVAKNIDGYRLSTYFNKDRGKKIKMGPIWDFNLSMGNADYNDGWEPQNWYWQISCNGSNDNGSPFWWYKLWTDTAYVKEYACRWSYFRSTVFSDSAVNFKIDSMAALLQQAQARHFTRWQILGQWLWPNAFVGSTWQQEIDTVKGWMRNRMAWMDSQLPTDSNCLPQVNTGTDEVIRTNGFRIFPNPSKTDGFIAIQSSAELDGLVSIRLLNAQGALLWTWNRQSWRSGENEYLFSLKELGLSQGVYFVQWRSGDFLETRKLVLE